MDEISKGKQRRVFAAWPNSQTLVVSLLATDRSPPLVFYFKRTLPHRSLHRARISHPSISRVCFNLSAIHSGRFGTKRLEIKHFFGKRFSVYFMDSLTKQRNCQHLGKWSCKITVQLLYALKWKCWVIEYRHSQVECIGYMVSKYLEKCTLQGEQRKWICKRKN